MSETKAEYTTVCTDELTALILEVQNAGYNLAESCQWGTGRVQSTEAAGKARAALREYVDALVKNGITAQIAENLEHIDRLEFTVDGYQERIKELSKNIDKLQSENSELQEDIERMEREIDELESEIRERDE